MNCNKYFKEKKRPVSTTMIIYKIYRCYTKYFLKHWNMFLILMIFCINKCALSNSYIFENCATNTKICYARNVLKNSLPWRNSFKAIRYIFSLQAIKTIFAFLFNLGTFWKYKGCIFPKFLTTVCILNFKI